MFVDFLLLSIGTQEIVLTHDTVDAFLSGYQSVRLSFLHAFLHFHITFCIELAVPDFNLKSPAKLHRQGAWVFFPVFRYQELDVHTMYYYCIQLL